MFFRLGTEVLALLVFGVTFGATVIGLVLGRTVRIRSDEDENWGSLAVMQAALLTFMALVLAFGLSLAVGRYEARRAAVVVEVNAISTTYLRAQTLEEPTRTESLELLREYTDLGIRISTTVPESAAERKAVADSAAVGRQLWQLADDALEDAPDASAPRLYVESLNEAFDARTARVAGLANRVPTTVMAIEIGGAVLALALLGVHLAVLGRGYLTSLLAALLVSLMLLVTFDLDRPTRGLITVPSTTFENLRASMDLEPAASPSGGP